MTDSAKVIGKRLVRLRIALGCEEQIDFCRALKIGKSTYNPFETGKRTISLRVADLIHTKYKVPLDYIYYGDESELTVSLLNKLKDAA